MPLIGQLPSTYAEEVNKIVTYDNVKNKTKDELKEQLQKIGTVNSLADKYSKTLSKAKDDAKIFRIKTDLGYARRVIQEAYERLKELKVPEKEVNRWMLAPTVEKQNRILLEFAKKGLITKEDAQFIMSSIEIVTSDKIDQETKKDYVKKVTDDTIRTINDIKSFMNSRGYEKEFNAIIREVNQSFQDFQRDIFLNSAIENIMFQLEIIRKSIMSKYSEEKEDEETDEDTLAERKDNIKKESDAVKEIEAISKNLDDGMIKNAVDDCLNVLQHGDLETKQNAIETLEETLKQIANPLRIEIKRGFAGGLKMVYFWINRSLVKTLALSW